MQRSLAVQELAKKMAEIAKPAKPEKPEKTKTKTKTLKHGGTEEAEEGECRTQSLTAINTDGRGPASEVDPWASIGTLGNVGNFCDFLPIPGVQSRNSVG
jgi:hypothetical protein